MIRLACLLVLSLAASTAMAAPTLYRFDTVHSQVLFSVSHNGFSSPVGRLHLAGGWLQVDPDNLATARTELDIDLASVDMGDADWDRAVRGAQLLDTDGRRLAHFISTSISVLKPHQGILHGKLTLRGQTRPADVAFTLNRAGTTIFGMQQRIGFSARAHLNRKDFAITAFPGSIGQWVTIRLEIEAERDNHAIDRYRKSKP